MKTKLYNSPLEYGLRSLFLLAATAPKSWSLDDLIILDYVLIHSADFPGGPESLHAPVPHRSGELLVKRDRFRQGVELLVAKGLIRVLFQSAGFEYESAVSQRDLIERQSTFHARALYSRAQWIEDGFLPSHGTDFRALVRDHLRRWGTPASFLELGVTTDG